MVILLIHTFAHKRRARRINFYNRRTIGILLPTYRARAVSTRRPHRIILSAAFAVCPDHHIAPGLAERIARLFRAIKILLKLARSTSTARRGVVEMHLGCKCEWIGQRKRARALFKDAQFNYITFKLQTIFVLLLLFEVIFLICQV